jgi:hypothetical protein
MIAIGAFGLWSVGLGDGTSMLRERNFHRNHNI